MEVIVLDNAWESAYEQFVRARPASLLYASLRYRSFLKRLLGCDDEYLLAIDNGAVVGALPLMKFVADGAIVYNSLPYYGSNGGVMTESAGAARRLVDAYNQRLDRPHVAAATIIPNPFDEMVEGFRTTHADVRIAQWIELTPDDADLEAFLTRIDSSARRNVRKALTAGVTVRTNPDQMPALRDMHVRNMAAIGGRSKSDRFFQLVPEHFEAGRDWDLHTAEHGGQVIAALLVFYFGQTAEYFTPAVEESSRELQALPLIIAHAVGAAARRGMTRWNFGATWESQTGVYRFKKKWASLEKRYSYATFVGADSLLEQSPHSLLDRFGNFYVVPFSALRQSACEHGKEAAA